MSFTIINQAVELYSKLDPKDIRDAAFYVHPETRIDGMNLYEFESRSWPEILGIPVRADPTIPIGEIRLITETNLDRSIRRAARDGRTVNVVKPVPMMPEVIRETPTLRALLRHWKGKVFGR